MYQETRNIQSGDVMGIIRDDGVNIPLATGNPDYQRYIEWVAQGNAPTPDPEWTLAKVKNKKIATINSECTSRIILKWPLGLQSSINMGLYPALVDQCRVDIAATVDASNTQGRDVVNACASIAAVQAVTINWPII
jgi:hypothetical protein